jgi:hypothetical protein
MNTVRTLPFRVLPIQGEGLDSWLEALACRTHTAFGDLLTAVGLSPDHKMGTSAWIVQLMPGEAAAISAATGVNPGTLEVMTLAHYSGRAVLINGAQTLSRAFPWTRTCGSRFCPACLEKTAGRWQLAWRLGWAFACTEHHCLLADACPYCGGLQRRRTHIGDIVPHAGRCACPAASATGRHPARCDTTLAAAPVTVFDPAHPVMHAQRIVNAIIDSENATFGVYRIMPQPRINVLADIRAVAGRVLAYATPEDLASVVPDDLLAAYHEVSEHTYRRSQLARSEAKPGLAAPARAAAAAVGVVAAVRALHKHDIASAGDELRWLVTSSRKRGFAVSATNIGWGKNTSQTLTGAQLAALGPVLNPSDQLRYRIGATLPTPPTPCAAHPAVLACRLPSMLWPALSLRLSIPNCRQRHLRPALSIAVLLVHSRLSLGAAARLIDSPIEGHAVSRVLQLLEQHGQWHSIRSALIRIADFVTDHPGSIDYQRRRRLDYTALLPDRTWAQICRDTATPGPRAIRAKIARCFLFERVSSLPARVAPSAHDDGAFRTKVADFPAHLTPELAHALDEHAREFLAGHGIDREPTVWHPPAELFDGLDLPGPKPDTVNLTELHRMLADEGAKLGAAAACLGADLDTVRYLLEVHPAPPSDPAATALGPPNHNRAYYTAKTALPRDRFTDLYHQRHMSLRDIAATVGVSRQTVARLAHDYDVLLREPGPRTRKTLDRNRFRDQDAHGALCPDIAHGFP